ncbi:MAG: hypothetical protein ACP5QP_02950 [Brevinematia bacterium]
MSEISKAIEKILEANEKFSKKVEEAKLEAKRISESAKNETESYRIQKENELKKFKLILENEASNTIKEFKEEQKKFLESQIAKIEERVSVKSNEIIEEIATEVEKEILNSIL